jgi:hypothetical protein
MLKVYGILGVALLMSLGVLASNVVTGISPGMTDYNLVLADTRGKDRRDGREEDRDDRGDCREEEGVVGKDKRDCKKDNRRGEDDA